MRSMNIRLSPAWTARSTLCWPGKLTSWISSWWKLALWSKESESRSCRRRWTSCWGPQLRESTWSRRLSSKSSTGEWRCLSKSRRAKYWRSPLCMAVFLDRWSSSDTKNQGVFWNTNMLLLEFYQLLLSSYWIDNQIDFIGHLILISSIPQIPILSIDKLACSFRFLIFFLIFLSTSNLMATHQCFKNLKIKN